MTDGECDEEGGRQAVMLECGGEKGWQPARRSAAMVAWS
jgi:hypothetical protein